MGITGLLPKLQSIIKNIHIQELSNLTVAIDAYVWLHRGAYACSRELCENIPTDKYIKYCMSFVALLRQYNIKPILVFDGGRLPMKGGKENDRHERRDANRKKALEHLVAGNISAANDCFQKAVDITPKMAHNLIKILKQEKVQYIVAPYEADAQLTYLCLNQYVDAVITEDSDLVVFGAKRIIFKLDKYGNAKELSLANLQQNKDLNFSNFTQENFRHMCLLSGCDYLCNVPGVGIMKAYQLINKHKDINKIFELLKTENRLPPDYEEKFQKADLTFLHQRVYDPQSRKIVSLTPLPECMADRCHSEDLNFMGPILQDEIAQGIADGTLDPNTREPFETAQGKDDVKAFNDRKHKGLARPNSFNDPIHQKNHIFNYFEVRPMPKKKEEEETDDDSQYSPTLLKPLVSKENAIPFITPKKNLSNQNNTNNNNFSINNSKLILPRTPENSNIKLTSKYFGSTTPSNPAVPSTTPSTWPQKKSLGHFALNNIKPGKPKTVENPIPTLEKRSSSFNTLNLDDDFINVDLEFLERDDNDNLSEESNSNQFENEEKQVQTYQKFDFRTHVSRLQTNKSQLNHTVSNVHEEKITESEHIQLFKKTTTKPLFWETLIEDSESQPNTSQSEKEEKEEEKENEDMDEEMKQSDLEYIGQKNVVREGDVRKTMNKRKREAGDTLANEPKKMNRNSLDSYFVKGSFTSPFVNNGSRLSLKQKSIPCNSPIVDLTDDSQPKPSKADLFVPDSPNTSFDSDKSPYFTKSHSATSKSTPLTSSKYLLSRFTSRSKNASPAETQERKIVRCAINVPNSNNAPHYLDSSSNSELIMSDDEENNNNNNNNAQNPITLNANTIQQNHLIENDSQSESSDKVLNNILQDVESINNFHSYRHESALFDTTDDEDDRYFIKEKESLYEYEKVESMKKQRVQVDEKNVSSSLHYTCDVKRNLFDIVADDDDDDDDDEMDDDYRHSEKTMSSSVNNSYYRSINNNNRNFSSSSPTNLFDSSDMNVESKTKKRLMQDFEVVMDSPIKERENNNNDSKFEKIRKFKYSSNNEIFDKKNTPVLYERSSSNTLSHPLVIPDSPEKPTRKRNFINVKKDLFSS